MKRISHKELVQLLDYESEIGLFRWRQTRGSRAIAGSVAGSTDPKGYVGIEILGVRYPAHVLAWFYVYAEWPKTQIDHRNGVKSCNAFWNLRLCNTQENCSGRLLRKDSGTGFKGVTKAGDKWRSRIRVNYRPIDLGRYESPQLAAAVYDLAAIHHYGEFARTNKMLGLL